MINGPGGLRKGPLPICQRSPFLESIDHFWAFFRWLGWAPRLSGPHNGLWKSLSALQRQSAHLGRQELDCRDVSYHPRQPPW